MLSTLTKVARRLLYDHDLVHKLIIGLILGAFCVLLVDIRYEHRAVMAEKWQSWVPLVYLAAVCLISPIALVLFNRYGRKLLAICFVGAVFMGITGFFLHSKGQPIQKVQHLVIEFFSQPGHLSAAEKNPPILAPLSLAGLGLIGLLLSLTKPLAESAKTDRQ